MSVLAINVSSIISSLCYSILRLEPYSACTYNCMYCYGKWYRGDITRIKPQYEVVKAFEKVAKVISKKNLKIIPFRLSTLVEPFQKIEKNYKISLMLLKVAYKYNIPIIISTKSTLFTQSPWLEVISKLGEKGLALLQMTIVSLDERLNRILEPNAPLSEARIQALEKLSDIMPIVIRFQPIIPGLSEYYVKDLFKLARSLAVKHVIMEFLRCLRQDLNTYKSIAINQEPYEQAWTSYSPLKDNVELVTLPRAYKETVLRQIVREADSIGVKVTLCKEGLFNYDRYKECCGITYLRNAALRPTLREVWKSYINVRGLVDIHRVLETCMKSGEYITSLNREFREYPRLIRKPIRHHEKTLVKISLSELAYTICPVLSANA